MSLQAARKADPPPLFALGEPHVTLRSLWPLLLGVALLLGLWLGPLPKMAMTAFSPHMILHLGLVIGVGPLFAIGLQRIGVRFTGGRSLLGWTIAISLLDLVVVWGWHAPPAHEAAILRPEMFVLQQLSFLFVGVAVWFIGFGGTSRASVGAGLLAMLMSFMHMTMLGILLAVAPRLFYDPQFCLGAFGFDPLADQRFGGALMAVFGGLPYFVGAAFLGSRLLRD